MESAYYCIRVEHDIQKPSGRILWLDDLMHSYVDLDDPTYLEFDYIKSFSDAVAVAWPQAQALDALHIGGGGFTLPRYLAAEYPGTKSTVLEIDPTVLKIGRERLGLRTSKALRVRIGDAPHRHPRPRRTTRPTSSSVTRSAASPCPGTSAPGSSSRTSTACSGRAGCTSRT